jgi:hypothetical protein
MQNESGSLWLAPVNLNAGDFVNSTPTSLFDFPVLAPATSVAPSFAPTPVIDIFDAGPAAHAPT